MSLFKREAPATYQAVHGRESVRMAGTARSIRRALRQQQDQQQDQQQEKETDHG